MPEYRYTVAEYDPARPLVLVGALRQLTVEFDESEDFAAWAARAWPRPRHSALRWRLSAEASPLQRPPDLDDRLGFA
jgi:hypothetical protein